MASTSTPLWKQLFDLFDRRVSPTINEFAKSEDMATLAALGRRGRSELDRRLEQASRRTLHLLNMPAGSDMNRLLTHIARLEREVRDLRNELTDRENAEYLASLAARREQQRSMTAAAPGELPAARPTKAGGRSTAGTKPAARSTAATAKKSATATKSATKRAAQPKGATDGDGADPDRVAGANPT